MKTKLIAGLKECQVEIEATQTKLSKAVASMDYEAALTYAQEISSMLVSHMTVTAIIED